MIVHNVEQNSVDWMILRSGKPTASEFDQILTPEFKPRTGQMVSSYLAKKVAETWTGGPLASLNVFDMEQGHILEEEAIPWYELEFNEPIKRVGFITTDDGRIGCSPDGLIAEGGIEIKCPAIHTAIGYLLDGALPKDYACQVHGSMFVTGAHWWKFLSYRRKLPPLMLTIFRDEEIQEKIGEALAKFLQRLDAAMKRLEEINGGPAPKHYPIRPEQQPEPADVPH